jgi:hypothetical protein
MIGEMSVVPRGAKPFGSSLLESYWPEAEHLSNGLGSAVSFKIPMFGYVADLNELFTLARGWVIAVKRLLDRPSCLRLAQVSEIA